ncbi:GNAT family acetyltransferase [Vibrio metschnikovii]|uniref:GNAT family N-acetyltransferase/peptidase C39 family protein n=3 Tax=Bacteria TaxID=2 RepID=A0AAU6USH7_UNCXX|nr:GNAT family N-acetyltransferase/peptidase C39 family protein [Vibrio metschnikovii]EEX37784.1 ribosomal-protein-S18p-alanine acetyltransferase [Vibrio metschnikovii CIP 69.14]EKO3565078.1 GNAT family N-acetyltransferase/peptidase C39 family protein [Vibrio metschnikovii]EKO3642948.1 GNAT family N-acetyltransferase/peptidase C39 family protein [Vibrio metschnikovii]EKO3739285.1 GNAT family N-acetyltransferase/peptidase C39 family protein [Vibrio metschnikovii]EKO3768848.1 GNAT family N-acety
MDFRLAKSTDLAALNALEQQLFDGDKISPRQMKRFLHSSHSVIFVADSGTELAGYALLLFHQGTQLSRLYSIAVKPDFRGRRIAQTLVEQCERAALDQGFTTLRLEVREDNIAAIKLYEKMGYRTLKCLIHYYDDLCDGRRMQKRLTPHGPKILLPMPLYVQTTPFTCGAACLLMSFSCLRPSFELSRTQELQLWREATTIFMAAGHGGCSGQGLALAAAKRGFHVELWSQSQSTPFIDSVRDLNKKQVIELVHLDFCEQLAHQDVAMIDAPPTQDQLEAWVTQGACVLLLISTYRFDGKKEPHWIVLSGMSEKFFFFHDPHAESEQHAMASAYVPVGKKALSQIIGFGKQKQTACVVISPANIAR